VTDGNKPKPDGFSLKRWSERKLAAARQASAEPAPPAAPIPPSAPAAPVPVEAAVQPSAPQPEPELPPVETLTFESDFTAFLRPRVDEALKRQALKKLFRDPRFNTMDGLDVYIDDYTVPSPVTEEDLRQMVHARFTLDPPPTRVNALGCVEDVPPEERVVQRSAESPAEAPTPASVADVAAPDATPAALPSAAATSAAPQSVPAVTSDAEPSTRDAHPAPAKPLPDPDAHH
jgi:hypothetical protein